MNSRFVVISIFFSLVGCAISVPIQTSINHGVNKKVASSVNLIIEYTSSTPVPTTTSVSTTQSTTTPVSTTQSTTTPVSTTQSTTTPVSTTQSTTTPVSTTQSTITPVSTTQSTTTPTSNSTTPSSTTSPVSTPVTIDTPGEKPSNERQFDGPSFIGGIVLTVGLTAIGFIAFKFYIAGKGGDSKYRTLY